ncbi:MAG: hypothetical protein R3D63_05130 [Paracoccaceae bacterium]
MFVVLLMMLHLTQGVGASGKPGAVQSKVLRRLLSGDFAIEPDARTNWSRFLAAQMMRAPEDIEAYKLDFDHLWARPAQELEDWYQTVRIPEAPATLAEFLATMPAHERAAELVKSLGSVFVENKAMELFAKLEWSVRRVENAKLP